MKNQLIQFLLPSLVKALTSSIDVPYIKSELDNFIDNLEAKIIASENKIDDSLLPLLATIRAALDIPNDPEVVE